VSRPAARAQLAAAQLSLALADGGNYALPNGFTTFGAGRGSAPTEPSAFGFDLDAQVDLQVRASFGGAGDGDDYLEGNGGNDVIFGNLGQDDIVGDSSDLYGFALATQRPAGSDLIFGGAGIDISRNHAGDAMVDANGVVTVQADGHARDADTVVGDNGRLLRLVGVNGTPRNASVHVNASDAGANGVASTGGLLEYNYDNEAIGTVRAITTSSCERSNGSTTRRAASTRARRPRTTAARPTRSTASPATTSSTGWSATTCCSATGRATTWSAATATTGSAAAPATTASSATTAAS